MLTRPSSMPSRLGFLPSTDKTVAEVRSMSAKSASVCILTPFFFNTLLTEVAISLLHFRRMRFPLMYMSTCVPKLLKISANSTADTPPPRIISLSGKCLRLSSSSVFMQSAKGLSAFFEPVAMIICSASNSSPLQLICVSSRRLALPFTMVILLCKRLFVRSSLSFDTMLSDSATVFS